VTSWLHTASRDGTGNSLQSCEKLRQARFQKNHQPPPSNTSGYVLPPPCLLALDGDVEIPRSPAARRTFRRGRNKERDSTPGNKTDKANQALNGNYKFYIKKSHCILEIFYVKFNRISSSYCLCLYFLCFDLCSSKPVFFLFLFLFFTL